MKNLFLLMLFLLILVPVHAQEKVQEDYDTTLRNGLMGFEYRNSVERYKGNQYFNAWTKGQVNFKNGDVLSDIFLRYDQYMNKVLWLRETDFKTGVLTPEGVIRFVLYADSKEPLAEFERRMIKSPHGNDSSEVFLQVLAKGNLELCAYRKVKQSANDFRLLDDTHYLIFSGGKSCYAGLNRKSLLKVPFIDGQKLKSLIKLNRINLNGTEWKLIQVIDLYNNTK